MTRSASRRTGALMLCSVLAAVAPLLLGSCKGPRVKLPVRAEGETGSDDDDDDDDIVPCDATRPCTHSILKVCGLAGVCVECRTNADCKEGVCEPDGECSD